MNMRKAIAYISLLGMLVVAGDAYAGKGEVLYRSKACNTCHGPDGNTPLQAAYPKIGGQSAEYLVQQIKDIRDGKRNNGYSRVMAPLVKNLKDDEIVDISTWLSGK